MTLRLCKYLIIILCCTFAGSLKATHIVGGELSYTCLGNNLYEIQFTIFRDCFNGSPQAWFDDPASIGVFSAATNELVDEFQIPLDPFLNDTLQPTLVSECLTIPPDVCVHTTTYTTVENLPFLPGGYILSYQRCCRNQTINNIVEPLATGATYTVEISETALAECNSSPQFNTWPPLYICAGFPIFFDQSATDADGDSIVYSLCAPYQGADQDVPMPQPPNNPPYESVIWNDGFGVNDMLNGLDGTTTPLAIDSETGFLTGTPLFIGQYVVGICVEEYRDGELIGTTRRDFQYNVGDCGVPGAAFFAPEIQCDDLSVEFENESQNADDYLWFFDTENNPGATSAAENPTYIYSDYDTYNVMLVVNPETVCVDTAVQTVTLIPNPLIADFAVNFGECSDALTLEVTDMSTDSASFITDWFWEFSLNDDTQTSTEQDPEFIAASDGFAYITLTVTSETGCTATLQESYPIDVVEEELIADTLTLCLGDSVNLHPNFTPGYQYIWSPADYLDDPNSPNPLAVPTETITYTVQINNLFNGCSAEREITLFVPEVVTLDLGADYTTCETDVVLTAATNTAEQYFWASDTTFDDLLSTDSTLTVTPFGPTTYYLLVRDTYGCPAIDSVTVTGNGINHTAQEITLLCPGDTVTLTAQNLDPEDILTYAWTPVENIVSGADTPVPSVTLDEAGTSIFYLEMSNQFGCTKIDTLTVAAVDTTDQSAFVTSQQCSGYTVQFMNTSINAPYYIWNFGDPTTTDDVSTEDNPSYTYDGPGSYIVTLSLPAGTDCADAVSMPIVVSESEIIVDFDYEVTECGDSLTVQFTDLTENAQSNILTREWIFGNGDTAEGTPVETVLYNNQILDAQLIVTSDDGCTDTLQQSLLFELLEENLADTLTVCAGASAQLNPDGNPAYEYLWSPPATLDDAGAANPIAAPLAETTYTVTITGDLENYACEIIRTVTVIPLTPEPLSISGETESCGEELQLYTDTGIAAEWSESPDFTVIFAVADTVNVTSDPTDVFYARITDENGCTVTDSIETVNRVPQITLEAPNIICINDTVIIEITNLNPDDDLVYSWAPLSQIVDYTPDGSAIVSPSGTDIFTVSAYNQFGCETTASVEIQVLDFIPPLEAFAEEDSILLGESTQLFSTEYPNYLYQWSPGGSLSSTSIFNPLATPEETTTYTVRIEDINGCHNTAEVTVTVTEVECIDPFVFIPNTFSPDGDETNETFGVLSPYVEEMYLVVYNRWGEKMFESYDPAAQWDGTLEGSPLAPDVYAYYCRVTCRGGSTAEFKGNVTLLR